MELTAAVERGSRSCFGCIVDALALGLLGLLLALPLRGYCVRPHIDFFDLSEPAYDLVHGRLPRSFKRAPVYPLVIGLGGEALRQGGITEPPPEQIAAEWLNTLLLPVNGVLVYFLGRRWMQQAASGRPADRAAPRPGAAVCVRPAGAAFYAAGHARWLAVWFLFLPCGLYCTTQLLLEPLLVTTMLVTLLLSGASRRWPAYVAAAVAVMVRYDATGLLLGLIVVDWLRGIGWRRILGAVLPALVPLVVWLLLTAATKAPSNEDHYIRQIAEEPVFTPLWALRVPLDVCFNPEQLWLPVWMSLDSAAYRAGIRVLLTGGAVFGTVLLLVRRDPATIVATCGFAAYTFVHAIFPFQWLRFGYPWAPLLLMFCGTGIVRLGRWLQAETGRRAARTIVLAVLGFLGLVLMYGEFSPFAGTPLDGRHWVAAALVLSAAPLFVLLVSCRLRSRRQVVGAVLAVGGLLVARIQLREATVMLGDGQDLRTTVDAARWVACHVPPEAGVLCNPTGLYRLYDPTARRERFVGMEEIAAETWTEIVAECRARGVFYVVWHDDLFKEHTPPRYAALYRLARFRPIAETPHAAPGMEVVWERAGRPRVWILRLR